MRLIFEWFLRHLREALDKLTLAAAAERAASLREAADKFLDEHLAKLPSEQQAEVRKVLEGLPPDPLSLPCVSSPTPSTVILPSQPPILPPGKRPRGRPRRHPLPPPTPEANGP